MAITTNRTIIEQGRDSIHQGLLQAVGPDKQELEVTRDCPCCGLGSVPETAGSVSLGQPESTRRRGFGKIRRIQKGRDHGTQEQGNRE